MKKKVSGTPLNAWRQFITAHARIIEQIEKDLLEAQCVPLNWYDVLVELAEAPERRLRMSDLAERVILSRSGLSRLVDRLEAGGLLRRVLTPTDGRGAYAVLTEDGMEALRKAWPVYAAAIQQHFASLMNDEEANLMADAFTRMLRKLGKA